MITETRGLLETGSYSEGTLRDADLLEMFDTIGALMFCGICIEETRRGYLELDASEFDQTLPNPTWSAAEILSETITELFDHINLCHTPDGSYFGSIEGDGACFGIWEYDEDEYEDETNDYDKPDAY